MALGARRRAAGGLILGEALRLAALGIAIATPAIWVLGRLIESQLYGVAAADPFVVALATLLLLLVSFAASAVPAWRASRIDPLAALNVE